MNKKNLTNEKIIKALDICYNSPCCSADCPYFNKNGRNFCIEKVFYRDLKRIVEEHAEQKAEIERLTEENGQLKGYNSGLEYENAELQKQVDELLNRRIEPKIFQCHADTLENCPKVEQAVKDTAKEIADWLITTESDKEDLAKIIKEHYGVEVE